MPWVVDQIPAELGLAQSDCYDALMPQWLPDNDFRARRTVLTRADFAHAPNPAPLASDLVAKPVWDSIVTFADDVAVRTSNYHGTALRQLDDLWGAWVESFGEVHDCLFSVMLDAGDDFQSATYTALTGFYRLSASALRSALELTTIGTWGQVCGKEAEYRAWRAGETPLPFARACGGLMAATSKLREYLRETVNDSLFDQRTSNTKGGFARRIYAGLSSYSHARPGYSDGDLRASNGPIYVRSVFNHVSWMEFETIGLCFVLFLLARPHAVIPEVASSLFEDVDRIRSRVTRAAFCTLYRHSE